MEEIVHHLVIQNKYEYLCRIGIESRFMINRSLVVDFRNLLFFAAISTQQSIANMQISHKSKKFNIG